MANHAITPDYSGELRELLTSDPAHADVFNPLFSRLINNDAFMKAFIERTIKEHNHSGADGEGSRIPFENIEVPTGLGNILTDKDLADHTNERNPHGTRASDVGAAPAQKLDEHLAEDASITKKGHVQLSSAITSIDETKAATPHAVKKVNDKLDIRLDEAMPLRFTDGGKTYRWGFRMLNGDGQFIYEEVIG